MWVLAPQAQVLCAPGEGIVTKPITLFSSFARRAALATALAGVSAMANAGTFACIAGTFSDCALATSTLSWTWNGLDFTIANSGSGYVSEVYFDLTSGESASFLGGTGGNVNFYVGATPSSLPGGSSVGFVSDVGFDSDPAGITHNGLDIGETGTFRITGATLTSFDSGTAAGAHVRSLIDAAASLVTITTPTIAVAEPETYALLALGVGALALALRRRKT